MANQLGKLESVDLREQWPDEARDFTPWLAGDGLDLKDYMESKKTFLSLKTPRPQHWYSISVGRTNFAINLTVNSRESSVWCELFMSADTAKNAYDQLFAQKAQIEAEMGFPLNWDRLEERIGARINVQHDGSIDNPIQREDIKAWMHTTAEMFHKVFSPRVRSMTLEGESTPLI